MLEGGAGKRMSISKDLVPAYDPLLLRTQLPMEEAQVEHKVKIEVVVCWSAS